MNASFPVAICCSGPLLPGLHAAIASLTRSLSAREKIALHLFIADIDAASRNRLAATIADSGGVGELVFHEPDLSDFAALGGLHGDRMTYLRLKLPDLLPQAATILYLDADIVVNADVCELFALPLGDAPLGAVPAEAMQWNFDHAIFRRMGLADDDLSFNAGVLLLNATWWRANNFLARALEFARDHPEMLQSHDQTILNIFCSRIFYHLPLRFNHIVSAETLPLTPEAEIYHFMGSPKPWDPFGGVMHPNAHLWKEAIAASQFRWWTFLRHHAGHYVRRAWSIRRSYLRILKRRWAR